MGRYRVARAVNNKSSVSPLFWPGLPPISAGHLEQISLHLCTRLAARQHASIFLSFGKERLCNLLSAASVLQARISHLSSWVYVSKTLDDTMGLVINILSCVTGDAFQESICYRVILLIN